MAFDSKGLDDYNTVNERLADFREQYPDGSLQPADPGQKFEILKIEGIDKNGKDFTATFIVYTAAAYRTPEDTRPGIGMAWEVFPGRTPYTLGSELMNAETSAWGRAIVAALASDSKKGISSREEVRNRRAEQDDDVPRNKDGSISRRRATPAQKAAAGLMDDTETKAHNELRKGADGPVAAEDKGRVRHCSPGNPCREADCPECTPDADLWTAANPPLRTPKEALSLPAQIAMHFDRLGLSDRDVRLGYTAQLAGTGRIGSSKELTASQAKAVLEKLSRCRDQAALRELLDEGVLADA